MLTPCCQSACSPLIARVQVDYRVSIDYQWRNQPPHSPMTILGLGTIPRFDNQWVAANWQRDSDLHSNHLSTFKRYVSPCKAFAMPIWKIEVVCSPEGAMPTM